MCPDLTGSVNVYFVLFALLACSRWFPLWQKCTFTFHFLKGSWRVALNSVTGVCNLVIICCVLYFPVFCATLIPAFPRCWKNNAIYGRNQVQLWLIALRRLNNQCPFHVPSICVGNSKICIIIEPNMEHGVFVIFCLAHMTNTHDSCCKKKQKKHSSCSQALNGCGPEYMNETQWDCEICRLKARRVEPRVQIFNIIIFYFYSHLFLLYLCILFCLFSAFCLWRLRSLFFKCFKSHWVALCIKCTVSIKPP